MSKPTVFSLVSPRRAPELLVRLSEAFGLTTLREDLSCLELVALDWICRTFLPACGALEVPATLGAGDCVSLAVREG